MTDTQFIKKIIEAYKTYAIATTPIEDARRKLAREVGLAVRERRVTESLHWDKNPGDVETLWDKLSQP